MVRPKIGLAVGTFGDPVWVDRAETAIESSLYRNEFDAVSHVHGDTLSEARNLAAAECGDVDCVVFLDADDRLLGGYREAMELAWFANSLRSDRFVGLIQPATLGLYEDGSFDDEAVVIPPKSLYSGNFMVIGTMCDRRVFDQVGGFRELPALEDWDLWIRMVIAGCSIGVAKEAVYGVGVNSSGRNSNSRVHGRVYSRLRKEFSQYRDLLTSVSGDLT